MSLTPIHPLCVVNGFKQRDLRVCYWLTIQLKGVPPEGGRGGRHDGARHAQSYNNMQHDTVLKI